MANIKTVTAAESYAIAIQTITGVKPVIIYTDDKAILQFTHDQLPVVQAWFESELSKKSKPSNIDIQFLPVVLPVLLKKYAPYILLSIAGVILYKRMR
jgi:hypothetical protein